MKVLLSLDRSPHARAAARFLQRFPPPAGSELTFLHILEPSHGYWRSHLEELPDVQRYVKEMRLQLRTKAHTFLNQWEKVFARLNIRCQSSLVEGIPGARILSAIKKEEIDLAVVGTRGLSGFQRFLLGSVSEWVLNDAPCSVLLVRGSPSTKKGRGLKLLFATDGSSDAQAAGGFLRRWGIPSSSRLGICHVLEERDALVHQLGGQIGPTGPADLARLAKEIHQARERIGLDCLKRAQRQLKQPRLTIETVLTHGHPVDQILKTARKNRVDLIVMGSRGLTGLRRSFLGSVSQKVARHAPCSVLVVRRSQGAFSR